MITARAFAGKTYAVLGLARSGVATVEALLASGAKVVAWDSKEEARDSLGTREGLTLADPLETDLTGFAGVVVSPGVPLNRHPIAAHAGQFGVPVIGDVELFAQARAELPPHKVVGITGTNGKSTTTALVHHILETAGVPTLMGGNIGLPILSRDPLTPNDKGVGVYVLELSSYQIDLTFTLDCDVAVLLNVTPDHLDRYDGSFESYVASKLRLFEMMGEHHEAVFNWHTEYGKALRATLREKYPHQFSSNYDDNVTDPYELWGPFDKNDKVGSSRDHLSIQKDWPALQGPHNAQNAINAILTCLALGVDEDIISEALKTYASLPHRMQAVRQINGVTFINDSKATNPDSTAPALAAYPDIHWIVGGRAKGETLGPCKAFLNHVRGAYTIGESGPMFAGLLREAGVTTSECEVLERAVKAAADAAKPGEVVLLSPACASFDQFTDFEARGDAFRAAVEAL